MSTANPTQIRATGEAIGFIPAPGDQPSPSGLRLGKPRGKPITVIGTNSIRAGFDNTCLPQALKAKRFFFATKAGISDKVALHQ